VFGLDDSYYEFFIYIKSPNLNAWLKRDFFKKIKNTNLNINYKNYLKNNLIKKNNFKKSQACQAKARWSILSGLACFGKPVHGWALFN
jgi:hypothetical protein